MVDENTAVPGGYLCCPPKHKKTMSVGSMVWGEGACCSILLGVPFFFFFLASSEFYILVTEYFNHFWNLSCHISLIIIEYDQIRRHIFLASFDIFCLLQIYSRPIFFFNYISTDCKRDS